MSTVADFLFLGDGGECRRLQVRDAVAQSWMRTTTVVEYPGGATVPVLLIPGLWIELFLSSYGVGLVSIGIQPDFRRLQDKFFDESHAKQFTYRLAQRRPTTAPTLYVPHPQDDPRTRERMNPNTAPPPTEEARFVDRLGVLGGGFTLSELTDFLLSPLQEQFHYKLAQQQFSAYSVVRFGKEVDFSQQGVQAQLGPLLSGLAQVEEPTHAGAVEGAVDVPHQIVNTRHWAAVGFLGTAHLVADRTHRTPLTSNEWRSCATNTSSPTLSPSCNASH